MMMHQSEEKRPSTAMASIGSSSSSSSSSSTQNFLASEIQLPPRNLIHVKNVGPLCESELSERIEIMLKSEAKYVAKPDYIETVQCDGMRELWRSKVTAWLLEFEEEFGIDQDTIAVAINCMDRYLSLVSTKKSILQLLAMASIFVAAKLHEPYPIGMVELRDLADGTYLESDIRLMELELLRVINYRVNPITPNQIINHLIQYIDCDATRALIHEDAITFMDVVLPEYGFLRFLPSVQAVAVVLAAFEHANICSSRFCAAISRFGILDSPAVFECRNAILTVFYNMLSTTACHEVNFSQVSDGKDPMGRTQAVVSPTGVDELDLNNERDFCEKATVINSPVNFCGDKTPMGWQSRSTTCSLKPVAVYQQGTMGDGSTKLL